MIILRFFLLFLHSKLMNLPSEQGGTNLCWRHLRQVGRSGIQGQPTLHSFVPDMKNRQFPLFFFTGSLSKHIPEHCYLSVHGVGGACINEKTICNRWSLSTMSVFSCWTSDVLSGKLFWEFKNKRHILKDYRLNMKSSLLARHSHNFL